MQISAEPGIELGSLRSEGRDLTNCGNHARQARPDYLNWVDDRKARQTTYIVDHNVCEKEIQKKHNTQALTM